MVAHLANAAHNDHGKRCAVSGDLGVPEVSIVMPAYNAAAYIAEAIQSVIDQTFAIWELVVVDDCSTDGTKGIVGRFMAQDSRIILASLDFNGGVARARNKGVEIARGRYIAFLDSDDVWLPEKLERQLQEMESRGSQISCTSYAPIDSKGSIERGIRFVPPSISFEGMLTRNFIGCSTVLMDASLIKERRFDNSFFHEDYFMWMSLLLTGVLVSGVQDVLVLYRRHDSNRSKNKVLGAVGRWDVYRRGLGLTLSKSVASFFGYALNGVKECLGV